VILKSNCLDNVAVKSECIRKTTTKKDGYNDKACFSTSINQSSNHAAAGNLFFHAQLKFARETTFIPAARTTWSINHESYMRSKIGGVDKQQLSLL
jgi:hypothetical protein